MDFINDVLNTVRFTGNVFIHTNFIGEWGANFARVDLPVFHCVLQGKCFIKTQDAQEFKEMRAGDVGFLVNGNAHTIASSPGMNAMDMTIEPGRVCFETDIPDDKSETRLLCGVFRSEVGFRHPIFTTLPEFMYVPFSDDANEGIWSKHAVYSIDNALRYRGAGVDILVDRLYEILFVQILQRYFFNQDVNSFYTCHRSKHIHSVLMAVHSDPGFPWTLERMAEIAHQSRSTFAANFRQFVGMSPMSYLNYWRMQKARSLVVSSGLSLNAIAKRVGFKTQSGLNKAFRNYFGISPNALRRG